MTFYQAITRCYKCGGEIGRNKARLLFQRKNRAGNYSSNGKIYYLCDGCEAKLRKKIDKWVNK